MLRAAFAYAVVFLLASAAPARALPLDFLDTQIVTGLDQPVALAWSPDGRLFIAERTGRVKIWNGTTTATALTLSVHTFEEQGLLGLALDPDSRASPTCICSTRPGPRTRRPSASTACRVSRSPAARSGAS